jgi:glycosyltransferase involved in cell wall biosynthesis
MKLGVNTLFLIPGEVGGTETYLRQTLFAMAAERPGLEMCLFTQNENDEMWRSELGRYPQVSYEKLEFSASWRPGRIIREQIELPRRVGRAGVDMLWSPGYTSPIFCPVPQMVTICDMQYKSHAEDFSWAEYIATDRLVSASAARANTILAISEFSKSEIVRYTRVSAGKIQVTPLAVNPVFGEQLPHKKRDALLSSLGLDGAPFLLAVSNTYPHKNMAAAVHAFRLLEKEVPHRLVMVGQLRRGERDVEAAQNLLKDPDRLVRRNRLTRKELIALYQGADVFVMPSLYEGFGLPVLEAMTAGAPVVATRHGSIPEVGGDRVLYCDGKNIEEMAQRIRDVLQWGMEQRAKWVADARARAGEFSWAQTARRTIAAAERCLSGARRVARPIRDV